MSIFNIEKNGTGIEKNGTGIEKGGTGIETGGTGIEKNGTGIEKNGTGIRAFRRARGLLLAAVIAGAAFASSAMAAPGGTWEDWGDLGGTVQFGVQNKTLTASWSTVDGNGNPILLLGTGTLKKGMVNMDLYKVNSGYQSDPSEPMPFLKAWGHAFLQFDGCGNAQGDVSILKAEAAGTGDKAEAAGTGDKAEAAGTGDKAEAAGTGDKAEAAGTGDKAEAAGTGDKLAYYGSVLLVGPGGGKAEAAGTGDKAEAAGTGDKAGACR